MPRSTRRTAAAAAAAAAAAIAQEEVDEDGMYVPPFGCPSLVFYVI